MTDPDCRFGAGRERTYPGPTPGTARIAAPAVGMKKPAATGMTLSNDPHRPRPRRVTWMDDRRCRQARQVATGTNYQPFKDRHALVVGAGHRGQPAGAIDEAMRTIVIILQYDPCW